jgi:Abnormal spindle-like microcephaly-assoc'd, ASPM-SPD-2-Hydin
VPVIYAILPFSDQGVSALADPSKGAFSKPRGHRTRAEAKILRFCGLGKALTFVLGCCLTIVASGCGSGAIDPVGGGLFISPNIVNFGNVPVGHEVDSSVVVKNTSSSSIAVSQVNVSGQSFALVGNTGMPTSVPAGGTYTLKIGFTPVSAANYSGQATLMGTAGQMVAQVPLQGQGSSQTAPQLTVSATSLSFGNVTVNTATTQSLTLTSTGTSPVTVNSAAITGAGFTIVAGSFPVTLNPTQTATLQVQFNPTSPGAASGQISISSNSASTSTTVVTLAGTGVTVLNPQTSPQLAVSATSLSFGNVTVNTATTQSLTLMSTGTSPVLVSSAAITGTGFAIVGGSLPVTLNPTQSVTLQVQFDPTTTGTASGQVTISSNSTTGGTAFVALNGIGTAAPSPQLAVSAASLSFGSVTVNTATTQSLTLTSTGTAPVTVNSATIAGTGFTITGGSFPVTLSPTQSMTLQIQFLPAATGTASGQIMINGNSSSGNTTLVTLSGTSIVAPSPQLAVSAATLSFGSVTVNSATTQSLTLTSTGTAPVTVNSAAITGTGFTIVGGSFPVTLNPTQAVTLQVQFLPTATGTSSGQITINSDSSTGSSAQVTLGGTSTAAPSPQLTVSAASLSFGSVMVNTATTQSLTLTSTGTSPATISSATITGPAFTIVGGSFPVTLNPTQAVTLQVQFVPTATGSASGQITINSDSSTGSSAQVTLSGTSTAAPSPQLALSAGSLSFGSVTVNTATTQSLTLTSTGTSPVTVNSAAITGAGFTIVGSNLPVTLNPTQSMTLLVQFLPRATGTASGQITINSDSSTGSSAQVTLDGTSTAAPSPQLTVSAATLSFGSVTVNTATTQSLTLTSTGTSPVTISSATISGAGFTIVGGNLPSTLNPTQSMTLQVQFLPTVTGTSSGQITINSNSPTGSTAQVTLGGTSIAAPSPQLTVSAGSLSFGSVTVNTATTQSLTLASTGTSPVTISSATITGAGFTIVGGSFPVTLNPTQTVTLQIQFLPTVIGTASGQITISSDSSTGSTAQVTLSGTSAAAPSPQLTVSAATLSFGSVTVNTATTQSLTLTSTGTAPVTVSSAAITGTGFTIVGGSFPVTLNPTQAVTLQVQFLPAATGSASGQITINSDSSTGSTAQVTLSGTSTAAPSPQLTVSAATLSFGSVTVNTAATQSLTLTSTGTAPVTISSAAITGAGFTIVGGNFPVTLNPTQAVTVQVQFLPTVIGTASGQITINSDSSTGSTAQVTLGGTSTAALSPQLTVSAGTLSFGSVTVNTAATRSLTLTSTGTAPVTVSSAAITGAGFTIVSGSLPVTLNPTQTVTLQVQFLPTATGSASGQITITSNSSTGSTTAVTLGGTGAAASNPQLTVSATSLTFGSVVTNSVATASVTLTSTGTSAVTVNAATIAGAGFTIVAQSFPVNLNPTQSLTLQVQFKPTTVGAFTGQFTVSSNSTTGSTAVVALSGTGTAANPQLTVSAASLSFGSVAVNTATTLTLTLTSSGTTPVTVNSGTITGAGFTLVGGGFPVTIDPTQTLVLQLQFKPTTAGALTGQLSISSNSTTGSTAAVALSGTGTTVSHEVDLSWSAPTSSPDPVAGYNIYRSTGVGSLVLVNSSPDSSITYVDSAIVSGATYSYVVKSVDSSGVESVASNQITLTIP